MVLIGNYLQELAISMSRIANQYKNMLEKKQAQKVGCLLIFRLHYLVTMNVHMHAYCYPLFESGTKTDL